MRSKFRMADTDLGAGLKRLVLDSLRGDVELLSRAAHVGRVILRESQARPQSVTDVVKHLVRFNLEFHTLLTDYSQTFIKEVLDLAERTASGGTLSSERAAPGQTGSPPQLSLVGRRGDV